VALAKGSSEARQRAALNAFLAWIHEQELAAPSPPLKGLAKLVMRPLIVVLAQLAANLFAELEFVWTQQMMEWMPFQQRFAAGRR